MKKLLGLFAVGSTLALGAVAQAQTAMPSASPGGMSGPPDASVTATTTTTTTEPGTMAYEAPTESGTMPTTGGAPIAMAMSGVLLAAGGYIARRKLS